MEEKEILTNDTQTNEEEKQAAVAKMENIFEQVSAMKPRTETTETAKTTEAVPVEEPEPEENKTEVELMAHTVATEEEKAQQEKEREQKNKKKNRHILLKSVLCAVIAAIVIFGGYLCVDFLPKKYEGTAIITIPEGASTQTIAQELKDNHLIHSEFFFKVSSRLLGNDGKYNFGKFEIDRSSGYMALFKTLTAPGNVVESVKITIPEGYEIYKIADLLEAEGLIDKDKFYYLIDNGNFEFDFVKDIPKREMRLEGYLFPDTYEFVANDEYGIINEMLGRFEEFYKKYEQHINNSYLSMDELVTLASIIEREAGSADKKTVSSVFHNRILSSEYPYLQSCATVQYVLKERKPVLTTADTQIDSPYNTYINPGLPIGPIASPGEASIAAALFPEDTNYYFFVLGSDGSHHFAETYEEHLNYKNN